MIRETVFYVVIFADVTATEKISHMTEGEEFKWGIHWSGQGSKEEADSEAAIFWCYSEKGRKGGLCSFSEKGGLFIFIGA